MDVLRFTTAGSVDDGKSTLIGRLLYDTQSLYDDQLEAVIRAGKRRGDEYPDLSLVTDGLSFEREQGITVDVAYRYFSTKKRKFIITDTPGHKQYTRNMVTGASGADLSVVLVDSSKGITEQTNRHFFISVLLQIKDIVVCVNKSDLTGYSRESFKKIKTEAEKIAERLDYNGKLTFIPVSALKGDNIVSRSKNMPWYSGKPLLEYLEETEITRNQDTLRSRFPVQWVIRPRSEKHADFRGYAGRVAGGTFNRGDEVAVLPAGSVTKIKHIETFDGPKESAQLLDSVTFTTEDDIDVSRGDMIVKTTETPIISRELTAEVCWMTEETLKEGGAYLLRHTTSLTKCIVTKIHYKWDINRLEKTDADEGLGMNDICRLTLKTAVPIVFDSYESNRITGSFIIIDSGSNVTVGAGMIVK